MLYRDLYNTALSQITAACKNVSNFASLPAMYKAGYTHNVPISTNSKYPFKVVYTIQNPISEVASSTVSTAFDASMDSHGIKAKLDQTVTTEGLIQFYKALASFCTANVKVCGCPLEKDRHIVYVAGTEGPSSSTTGSNDITSGGLDVVSKTIPTILAANMKNYFVRYTVTMTPP